MSSLPTYEELLKDMKWRCRRVDILRRDEYKCISCDLTRPLLRNIVNKHGIFNYSELESKGINILNVSINDGREFVYSKNKSSPKAGYFVQQNGNDINIQDMYFAFQISDPNGFFKPRKVLISFKENVAKTNIRTDLNIHHKYYVQGKAPWDYPDNALETLCIDCHRKRHNEEKTPVFDSALNIVGNGEVCQRCFGSGYLAEYNYYMNGVCFQCSGHGILFNF